MPEIANIPVSRILGFFRMVFIAALQLKLKNITSGRATTQHQCTRQHPRGPGIPGTRGHSGTSVPGKGWVWKRFRMTRSRVIGLLSIKSIWPCSIPTARENIFHFHTNFIRFSTQKTNWFLRNEMKPKAKPFCFPHKSSFPFLWWGDGKLCGRWEEKSIF